MRDKLTLLEETAQANLAEARALVASMPPADLHDGGLLGALRRATDRCARENGVPTELAVCGPPRVLASPYDVVLLRVAQEALANVGKHSYAQHVTLTMTYSEAGTSLEVRDDGVGLASGVPPGFGLAGMTQRVEEAGGQLCVGATPGGGTTVRVRSNGEDPSAPGLRQARRRRPHPPRDGRDAARPARRARASLSTGG
jgi:signal transduction histidine kinase